MLSNYKTHTSPFPLISQMLIVEKKTGLSFFTMGTQVAISRGSNYLKREQYKLQKGY